MLKESRKIQEEIIDILFPRVCLGCGREGLYICKDCEIFLSEVNPITELRNLVSKCLETKFLSDIVSVWEYEGVIEKAILKIKYDGCYDIIDELMEKALEKIELNLQENFIITYVPMWKKKEKQRGYNQAKLIAQKLGEKLNRPIVELLEKIKDNQSQVDLSPQERLENIRGVFAATSSTKGAELLFKELGSFLPSSVLLVDDVYTTGATMQECARVLKEAGVKNIYGFTLARTMRI